MKKTLKVKFTSAFSFMVAIAFIIFGISMYTFEVLVSNFEDYAVSLSELNEFRYQFKEFNVSVEAYLSEGSDTELEKCSQSMKSLDELCESISNKYANSEYETQSSLVNAISSNYSKYASQINELLTMENKSEALLLYQDKYSKNGEYISDYIEKLTSYRYKISNKSLVTTTNQVSVFKVINIMTFIILAVTIFILFRMIFRNIITPLQRLTSQSKQIANYNFDIKIERVDTNDEVAELFDVVNYMKNKLKVLFESNKRNLQMADELLSKAQYDEGIEQFIEYQRSINDEIFKEANFDNLTNIMNQNAFINSVNKELEDFEEGKICAVFAIDIDDFFTLTQTIYEEADEILQYAAQSLQDIFEDYGIIARWNHDTFAGFISDIPNEETVYKLCQDIKQAMDINFKDLYQITASTGVYLTASPSNPERMFKFARNELSKVKAYGKNGYSISEINK